MSTRLYLRDSTRNVASYARGELSSQTPTVDAGHAARDLSPIPGGGEIALSAVTTAATGNQLLYFCKFISTPLQADIAANTWTRALASAESDANANLVVVRGVIYVMDDTGAVRGFVYDNAQTGIGTEWALTEQGRTPALGAVGAAVTGVAVGVDRLVFELWALANTITVGGTYTGTYYFNGATGITGGSAATDAGAYIETPQDDLVIADSVSVDYSAFPKYEMRPA